MSGNHRQGYSGQHAPEPPPKSKPFYIDYIAIKKDHRFIEVRYRCFPGKTNPSDNEIEQIFNKMLDSHSVEFGKRLFAKGFLPAPRFNFETVTDISQDFYGTKGTVAKLSKAYLGLEIDGKMQLYPPDAVRDCSVYDEVSLAYEFRDKEWEEIQTFSREDVVRLVKKMHEELRPCYLTGSTTPSEERSPVLPKSLVIFLDESFISSIEKYPSTIGVERLMIQSQRLLFPNNERWANQVRELETKFSSWRKSRGDGNCYYRAVSISYLEEMLRKGKIQELHSLFMKLFSQENYMIPEGFENHHFYFLMTFGRFMNEKQDSRSLVKEFQELEKDYAFDSAMIGVFRSMAAHWLETHSEHDEIFPFIMDTGVDPILRDIRSDEKEGEGLAFVAMANTLQANIHHIIADQNCAKTHTETFKPFSGEAVVEFSLLLRPGHYDLIYTREADSVDRYDTCLQSFSS